MNGERSIENQEKITGKDIHLFTVKDGCFLLDVEGSQVYSLAPDVYQRARDRLQGKKAKEKGFQSWKKDKELDAVWKKITPLKEDSLGNTCTRLENNPMVVDSLWLGIAHTCNLSCSYCFANEQNYLKNNKAFMDWETAKRAVDYLVEKAPEGHQPEIIFFGGEPLLRFDLLQRIVAYCESFRQEGKEFGFSITTNGTLLTPAVFDFLLKHRMSIMLSIDGTQAIHDRSRRYGNGRPSWNDIVTNLKKLPDFQKYIMARVTVLNAEVPLIDIYKTIRDIGFLDMAMTEVCPNSGEMPLFPDKEIPRWREHYLELAEYIAQNEPDAYHGGLTSLSGFAKALREREKDYYCCSTGISAFYVDPQGDLYPCMRLITKDQKNRLGTIWSGIEAEKVLAFRSNHIFNRVCRNCWARYICGGMCYGDSFALSGDISKTVEGFCKITQHKIETAAYFLRSLKQSGKIDQLKKENWFKRVSSKARIFWQ